MEHWHCTLFLPWSLLSSGGDQTMPCQLWDQEKHRKQDRAGYVQRLPPGASSPVRWGAGLAQGCIGRGTIWSEWNTLARREGTATSWRHTIVPVSGQTWGSRSYQCLKKKAKIQIFLENLRIIKCWQLIQILFQYCMSWIQLIGSPLCSPWIRTSPKFHPAP